MKILFTKGCLNLSLSNKSTGPASIPLRLLKIVADLIVVPLCRIINISFATGVFPDVLKVSKIIPLHKGLPSKLIIFDQFLFFLFLIR